MTVCENCGNEIRENRSHEVQQQAYECLVLEMDTKRPVGFSRRRYKDIYKKK
jgi:hypothetical protein